MKNRIAFKCDFFSKVRILFASERTKETRKKTFYGVIENNR